MDRCIVGECKENRGQAQNVRTCHAQHKRFLRLNDGNIKVYIRHFVCL